VGNKKGGSENGGSKRGRGKGGKRRMVTPKKFEGSVAPWPRPAPSQNATHPSPIVQRIQINQPSMFTIGTNT